MKNPYAKSNRDSDVATSPWPLVTQGLLQDALKANEAYEQDQINQRIHRLCLSHIHVNNALLQVQRAQHLWKDDEKVSERLKDIKAALEMIIADFPLTIRGK